MDLVNSRIKKGRKVSDVWPYFNDDTENHLKISGHCSHCLNLVTYHKKSADVKKHLDRRLQFKNLMNATEISERPEWYESVKKAKLTYISIASAFSLCGGNKQHH